MVKLGVRHNAGGQAPFYNIFIYFILDVIIKVLLLLTLVPVDFLFEEALSIDMFLQILVFALKIDKIGTFQGQSSAGQNTSSSLIIS